jgi:hypothetical protein
MDDSRLQMVRLWATAFRAANEATRAERVPGALPYFPDGACRMTSRLFAQYLSGLADAAAFGRPQLVSGILPGSEHAARHFWLELDGAVVDLTADAFGEAPIVVGFPTPFHHSLTSRIAEDAARVLASLGADETDRLARQLAVIQTRLSRSPSPGV